MDWLMSKPEYPVPVFLVRDLTLIYGRTQPWRIKMLSAFHMWKHIWGETRMSRRCPVTGLRRQAVMMKVAPSGKCKTSTYTFDRHCSPEDPTSCAFCQWSSVEKEPFRFCLERRSPFQVTSDDTYENYRTRSRSPR